MKTILFVADTHINSTVSLCKPVVNLDDGGSYHASKGQLFLWRSWENTLEQTEKRKTGEVITILDGDAVEGDTKDRSKQMITRNSATIKTLAIDVLEPAVKLSAGIFVVRGTEAHTGKSGEMEESLALDLNANRCPETNTASWYHLKIDVEGVKLDISHHPRGNGGGRPFNRYSMIDALASDTVFTYSNDLRQEPPHLAIRAHIHAYKDSYDHFRTRAITLPCFTLATSFINRIAPGAIADVGAVLIHCSAGHYEVEPLRYFPSPVPFYSIEGLKPYDPGI